MEKEKLDAERTTAKASNKIAKTRANFLAGLDEEEEEARRKKHDKEISDLADQNSKIMEKYRGRRTTLMALQGQFSAAETNMLMAHTTESEQLELTSHLKRLEEAGLFEDAKFLKGQAIRQAG